MTEKRAKYDLLERTILDRALAIVQIGSFDNTLRLILASVKTGVREITIELAGVAYYYYKPTPSEAIRTVHVGKPGTFAWRLGQQMSACTQIQLDGLIALSESVSFRTFEPDKDLNFPG